MKKLQSILLIISMLALALFVGCTNSNESGENKDNTAVENGQNSSDMSKEEYYSYMNGKYNEYLTNLDIDMKDDFKDIDIKSEEFGTKLQGAYTGYKDKLIALKNSLETDVKSSDAQVKEMNEKIIKSIDDTVGKIDDWSKNFEGKSKEFADKTADDIKSELDKMGSDVEASRIKLDELINESKGKLGL